jgi:hypothetical protein
MLYLRGLGVVQMDDFCPDIAVQIRKLAELHSQGILTDQEFATKKAELLARM